MRIVVNIMQYSVDFVTGKGRIAQYKQETARTDKTYAAPKGGVRFKQLLFNRIFGMH